MKLNDAQIKNLYCFVQKHYVEWFDVQTELVDHLANGIEAQWKDNPKLSFEKALQLEFKKFGICGFADVVEEKTKALNKHYWLLIWTNLKTYFKLPKITLTVGLIYIYFEVLTFSMQFHINWVLIPTLGVLFGLPWYIFFKGYKQNKRTKNKTGKKWLFDHTISQLYQYLLSYLDSYSMYLFLRSYLSLEKPCQINTLIINLRNLCNK